MLATLAPPAIASTATIRRSRECSLCTRNSLASGCTRAFEQRPWAAAMTRRTTCLLAGVVTGLALVLGAGPAAALTLWPTCPSPPGGDYASCTRGAFPQQVAAGSDGAVWFTTARANLGRVT